MTTIETIRFANDTATRKRLMVPESFQHPAKGQLGMWATMIERYSQPGDLVLDPMAGSGATLLAALMGRNVICVELEQHFVEPMRRSWEKMRTMPMLGHEMGQAVILRGDARALPLPDASVGAAITSPPYEGSPVASSQGEIPASGGIGNQWRKQGMAKQGLTNLFGIRTGYTRPTRHTPGKDGILGVCNTLVQSVDGQERSRGSAGGVLPAIVGLSKHGGPQTPKKSFSKSNDGLPVELHGNQDMRLIESGSVASETAGQSSSPTDVELTGSTPAMSQRKNSELLSNGTRADAFIVGTQSNAIAHPSNPLDLTISSAALQAGGIQPPISLSAVTPAIVVRPNKITPVLQGGGNVGDERGPQYWLSMSRIYAECWRVLKPGGIMALVLKGFTRDGKYVDLPGQTEALLLEAGWQKHDEWRRELWSLSFWRILQKRRDPAAWDERLMFEEVLAFRKPGGQGNGVDAVITSPPYEATDITKPLDGTTQGNATHKDGLQRRYTRKERP